MLATTGHPRLRNAAALALSDLEAPEAFDVIAGLLRQEHTRGLRGTLLYALRPYDCTPILPLLVDIVVDDTYESAREAAALIDGTGVALDDRSAERLRCAFDSPGAYAVRDPERREEVIGRLLELREGLR